VLVEGLDRKRRISSGRSRCNRVVNIAEESALKPGTLVNVRIERGFPNSLLGKIRRTEEEDFLRKESLERPSQSGDAASIFTGTF
jgi:hypothetical protein